MTKRRRPKQLDLFVRPGAPAEAGQPHEWIQFRGRAWACCRKCGVLSRDHNRPCIGIVPIIVYELRRTTAKSPPLFGDPPAR